MSRLDDIREELYRKRENRSPSPPQESPIPPRREGAVKSFWANVSPTEPDLIMGAPDPGRRSRSLRDIALIAGGGILVAVAGWVGYILFFSSADVAFSILGPSQVTAGEATVFTFRVANRSRVAIMPSDATITFPAGTALEGGAAIASTPLRVKVSFPDIPAGGEHQVDVRVRPFGVLGQDLLVTAIYLYRPENIQTKLPKQEVFHMTVSRLPVVVSVDAPSQASSGQDYTLALAVDAELAEPIAGLSLGIEFPNGFILKTANPALSAGSVRAWPLGDLASGTSQKFSITGTIAGDPGEVKSFHIRLGRYDIARNDWFLLTDTTAGPTIASPLLFTQATLNGARSGSFGPGERLDGVVSFKNNLAEKVGNVTILLSFPEKFVALETVRAEHGFYDVTKQLLTWNPASDAHLQELAPGESGTFAFSLTLKSQLPVKSFSDKNFTFPLRSAIDAASPPPDYQGVALRSEDTVVYKIESPISVAAHASYYDSPVANHGPLPPRVRAATTYTITFQLTSGSNDIGNVEVHAKLPGGVGWKGEVAKDLGAIDFNAQTQEMVWKIPQLPAATGILRPPARALIQLELVPAQSQVGMSPTLVQNISATGRDLFTASTQTGSAPELTIELTADKRSVGQEWRVVK